MQIKQATLKELCFVKRITQKTISKIYPKYYPTGAVKFFKAHHSTACIKNDIERAAVFLLFENEKQIATVTINENHINRLFVLEEYQHKGYGKALLDFAENQIKCSYDEVVLSASFPAKHVYIKRGYIDKDFCSIKTYNGDFLCYDVMVKK